jgi:hypothetical protein
MRTVKVLTGGMLHALCCVLMRCAPASFLFWGEYNRISYKKGEPPDVAPAAREFVPPSRDGYR